MAQRTFEKFIVGYFSTIGLIFLFGIGLNLIVSLFITPSASANQITSLSLLTSNISRFLPILYLFFLYKIWSNTRLVIAIGLSVYISLIPLGILFAFTFPVWIIFGLLCLVYAYATGLMKKTETTQIQSEITPAVNQPRRSIQRKIIFTVGFLFVLIGLFYFAFYGFRFPPCEYTDEIVTTPPELIGATILLEKDQYVGRGREKRVCDPLLKEIENQIIDSESINNLTIGKRYFEGRGLTVEILRRGKQFHVEKVIAATKHGLSTIDSGPGPIYYLILRDEDGVVYKIATVFLGFDTKESYLGVYKGNVRVTELSSSYFRSFYGRNY